MKLPDGTILMHGDLEHRAPYDPQKAREYYLRTRKLKGRKKGKGDELSPEKKDAPSGGIGTAAVKKKPKLSPQRQKNKEFLATTSKKLAVLNAQLKTKLANAQTVKGKAPKTTGEKKEEKVEKEKQPDNAEELKSQIDNLHQRLTSALARLQNIDIPTPDELT